MQLQDQTLIWIGEGGLELQDLAAGVPPPGSVSTRLDLISLQSSRIQQFLLLDPSQPGYILYLHRASGPSSSFFWIRPKQVISYISTELQDLSAGVPPSGSVPTWLYLISLQIIRIQQFLLLDPSQPGQTLQLYRARGTTRSYQKLFDLQKINAQEDDIYNLLQIERVIFRLFGSGDQSTLLSQRLATKLKKQVNVKNTCP